MTRLSSRPQSGQKWPIPLFCFAFGCLVLLVGWLGGQLASGLIGLVVMVAFGLFVAAAGRSETIHGLRGDGRDERFAQIDLRDRDHRTGADYRRHRGLPRRNRPRPRRRPVHVARRCPA